MQLAVVSPQPFLVNDDFLGAIQAVLRGQFLR